jgi:flagellar motility protein MotE (MotC chaperone)
MSAKDAAKVLEKLTDADISTILGSVNDKKAAEILALLPTERSAAISKTALMHRIPAK